MENGTCGGTQQKHATRHAGSLRQRGVMARSHLELLSSLSQLCYCVFPPSPFAAVHGLLSCLSLAVFDTCHPPKTVSIPGPVFFLACSLSSTKDILIIHCL